MGTLALWGLIAVALAIGLAVVYLANSRVIPSVHSGGLYAPGYIPVPPQAFAEGQHVRVRPGHVPNPLLRYYSDDVLMDDGYVFARVANAEPDAEGDLMLETLEGGHTFWVPADAVTPATDS